VPDCDSDALQAAIKSSNEAQVREKVGEIQSKAKEVLAAVHKKFIEDVEKRVK
jgi:hypothetical protein